MSVTGGYEAVPALTASGRGVDRPGETRGQDPLVICYEMDTNHTNHTGVATIVHGTQNPCVSHEVAFALGRNNGGENVLVKPCDSGVSPTDVRLQNGNGSVCGTLSTGGGKPGQGQPCVVVKNADLNRRYVMRRLTPMECERLQGFPDGWTLITTSKRNWARADEDMHRYLSAQAGLALPDDHEKMIRLAADGPRYKALGNSMAVPVMRWIGQRIEKAAKAESERN